MDQQNIATSAAMQKNGGPHSKWLTSSTQAFPTGRQPSFFRKHLVFSVAGEMKATGGLGVGGLGSKYRSKYREHQAFGRNALHVAHNTKKKALTVHANCKKVLTRTIKYAGK
jgi:hypothetical protein